MHPSVLAKRKAQAMDRIVQAARILDPTRAETLQPTGIKDAQAVEMLRLEAIADLLEGLVLAVPVEDTPAPDTQTGVTVVTEPHPVDEPEPVDDGRPTLEDFPAHVVQGPAVEEEPTPTKPERKITRRAKKSQ
jgi:hypothetical protein